MAVRFSSESQSFVIDLDPQDLGRRERDLRDIDILYLHVNKNENGEGNIETIGNIYVGLQKVEQPITEFRNIEECFNYIRERPDAKICLILSNGLDENRMSTLKKYPHVLFIYQFDSPFLWVNEEDGTDDSDDASRNSVDFLPQNNTIDSRLFIKYQLLMEILLRLPVTEESRKDFIDWSLENYPGNKEYIDLFAATFIPDEVIAWYTKDSFVHRILARTFASNDFRLIYKTRYFIRHLYAKLKSLHEETFALLDPKIVVYRGKAMPISAFDKLKASIQKLVITKCFLSASLNKDVARWFSGDTEVKAGDVAIIFRMKIDKLENKSKAFAFIGKKSSMPGEDEFLLGPGIIFRNKNITKAEENMFVVELIHSSEEEEIEEETIRSNTNHLEGVQNIESPDDFDLFITNTSNPLNEQVTPQQSEVQDDEQNNRPTEPQPSGVQDDEQNDRLTEPQPSGVQDDEQNNRPTESQSSGLQDNEQNNRPTEPQPSGVQDDERNDRLTEPQPSGVQDDEQNNRPTESQSSGLQDNEQNNRPTEPQPSGVQDDERNNRPTEPQPSRLQNDEENNRPTEPQPAGVQNDEQNNRPTEPQLIPMIQQQTAQQMTENLPRANSLAERNASAASNRICREIHQLQRSNICNGTSAIFSIDQTPFNDEDDDDYELVQRSNVIIGRIFPRSDIYNQRAYKIEISFPPSYPFNPPTVRIITPFYHPNLAMDGTLCLEIVQDRPVWSLTTSLASVLIAALDLIDNPDMASAVNLDAALEYMDNRAEFDRKALEMVREHGLPRQ